MGTERGPGSDDSCTCEGCDKETPETVDLPVNTGDSNCTCGGYDPKRRLQDSFGGEDCGQSNDECDPVIGNVQTCTSNGACIEEIPDPFDPSVRREIEE